MQRDHIFRWLLVLQCWVAALLAAFFFCNPALAQQRYPLKYVPGTEEGGQIELIQHHVNPLRKMQSIETFLERFPTHEATDHFLDYLVTLNSQLQNWEKVLQWGEKLMARHPEDLDTIYRMATAAQQLNDPVRKSELHQRLIAVATATLAAKQPPKDLDPALWAANQKFARELLDQEEATAFSTAVREKDLRTKIRLCENFLKAYPKSKYLDQIWPHLIAAYRATGENQKSVWAAEKMLAVDPTDLDALLLVAQASMENRAQYSKVITHANRILQLAPTKPRPSNYSAEEWEKRKAYYIGSANLLLGNVYVNQNSFHSADRYLRAALNYFRTADQTQAGILFYLGWSNYHLERYQEAASFFRQCMNIAGPFREQAWKNITAMKNERRIVE
ncbi:MAG: hypothetical protein NZV14_06335 [Bryobacteraceae bacterium]|nr:hypothetical protein [Bryobacteraceae bacterium]MDW8377760.1 hypothetical protein [Bryobacterales bacterium]